MKAVVIFLQLFENLLRLASLFFSLSTTEPSSLPVLEQAVLLRREELPHADQLSLADYLDIDGEVSSTNDIDLLEVIVDVSEGALVVALLRLVVRIVVRHTLGKIPDEISRDSQVLNPLLVLLLQRSLALGLAGLDALGLIARLDVSAGFPGLLATLRRL